MNEVLPGLPVAQNINIQSHISSSEVNSEEIDVVHNIDKPAASSDITGYRSSDAAVFINGSGILSQGGGKHVKVLSTVEVIGASSKNTLISDSMSADTDTASSNTQVPGSSVAGVTAIPTIMASANVTSNQAQCIATSDQLSGELPPSPVAEVNPAWECLVDQLKAEKSNKKPVKSKKEVGVPLASRRQTRSGTGQSQDNKMSILIWNVRGLNDKDRRMSKITLQSSNHQLLALLKQRFLCIMLADCQDVYIRIGNLDTILL